MLKVKILVPINGEDPCSGLDQGFISHEEVL